MKHTSQPAISSGYSATEDRPSRALQVFVVSLAVVFSVMLVVWLILDGRPQSLQLRYNPYALLSIAACLINVFALVLVSRIKQRTEALLWFSLHLLSLAAWAAGEALTRLSATPDATIFWAPLATLGSTFMPISLYMFAMAYTNSRRSQQPIIFLNLVAVTLLLNYADFRSNIIDHYAASALTSSPWGYIVPAGPAYFIIAIWFILLCAAAIIHLARFRRRTIEPTLRHQALLFIVAISIPVIIGTVTDGLLPALHIVAVPPLTIMLTAAMGLIISYGILKYRFFSFTPGLVAGQILETMNEAVIGVRPDFGISYANDGAARLLGLSPAEISRRSFTELLSQEWSPDELKQALSSMLAERTFGTFDSVDLRTANGSIITTKLSITKVNEDQSYGYLVVMTDITAIAHARATIEHQVAEQTKTIRDTKTKLNSSINSLEFGFIITDSRPEVTMINDAAHAQFCGSHEHDASNCPVVTLAHIEKQLGPTAPLASNIRESLAHQRFKDIKSTTSGDRTWRVFISPMLDESVVTGAAVIIQDITEEQIMARSRDEFFSIASHELRTPLTAIKGNSSLMLQYFKDALKDPSLHEMVEDIHDSSNRLIAIVNDFLDVSRLEQSRVTYNFGEVSIKAVAEKVVYELAATSKQKGIYVKLGAGLGQDDHLPPVLADPARAAQIIYNLVGNASKFTDRGGITIAAAVDGAKLKVTVTDTGYGIAPDMQILLFHKFQQASESLLTRDAARGTGLGLYISRLLAEGMHGKLGLQSSERGKGSTFFFTLPIATPAKLKKLTKIS